MACAKRYMLCVLVDELARQPTALTRHNGSHVSEAVLRAERHARDADDFALRLRSELAELAAVLIVADCRAHCCLDEEERP